jgi:two-component system response regulator FixJ
VSLVLEDDLPQVFIDKIQIQLVLFNLVRNAMEALERSPRREIGIKTYAARTERSKSRSGTQAQASTRAWLISCLPSISRQRSMVWESGCPGMSGLQLQTQLAEQGITLPVIVITGHADVPMAVAAMRAGAVDFIEKPFNDDTIISSVQRAFEIGIKLRDEGLSAAALKARIARLTVRERDVFLQAVAGKPNKVIAHELGISIRTVEVYRARVMEKLNASNFPHLIRMALVAGIG